MASTSERSSPSKLTGGCHDETEASHATEVRGIVNRRPYHHLLHCLVGSTRMHWMGSEESGVHLRSKGALGGMTWTSTRGAPPRLHKSPKTWHLLVQRTEYGVRRNTARLVKGRHGLQSGSITRCHALRVRTRGAEHTSCTGVCWYGALPEASEGCHYLLVHARQAIPGRRCGVLPIHVSCTSRRDPGSRPPATKRYRDCKHGTVWYPYSSVTWEGNEKEGVVQLDAFTCRGSNRLVDGGGRWWAPSAGTSAFAFLTTMSFTTRHPTPCHRADRHSTNNREATCKDHRSELWTEAGRFTARKSRAGPRPHSTC
ncbi:hypothetical protein J3F83DRAFT_33227 [Trichoderma novae-zelandiae]